MPIDQPETQKVTPSIGTAANYGADQRDVKRNSTVKGQMEDLLSSDSKYLKTARDNAAQTSNNRGLLFSSMAAGAGEKAAIESAMPIASQDASTYSNQSLANQQAGNQERQFNTGNKQQMTLANMDSENRTSQFNASQAHDQVMASLGADLEKGIIDQKSFANLRGQYLDSYTSVVNETNINISEIQTSDAIPAAEKQKMIDQQIAMRNADMKGMEALFKSQPMWQQNWANL